MGKRKNLPQHGTQNLALSLYAQTFYRKEIARPQKAEFFFKQNTFIHVDAGEKFYNGTILEVCDGFLIFKDRFIGEVPIFFNEIESLEPYKQAPEVKKS